MRSRTALEALKKELAKPWPGNREVRIVAHGHSVPAGYFATPDVRTFDAYPHLFHRRIKESYPYAVVNMIVTAIGGENSEQGAARFGSVLALRPDLLLIDYALNDRGIGLERADAAWRSMVQLATSAGIAVMLLTPTPDMAAGPQDSLAAHADQVRRIAREEGALLADASAAFEGEADLGRFMSQSNHPNREGHVRVATKVWEAFAL